MRRVLHWLIFVAALAALGALVHAAAPPTPRWKVRVPDRVRTPDAATLIDREESQRVFGAAQVGDRPGPVPDAATAEALRAELESPARWASLACSGAGRWVARIDQEAGGGPATLRWKDVRTGRRGERPLPPGHYVDALFPAGEGLIFVGEQATDVGLRRPERLLVIDPETGKHVTTLRNGEENFNGFQLRGDLLCYGGEDGRLVVWDARTRRRAAAVPGGLNVEVSAGGRLAVGNDEREQTLWRLGGGGRPQRVAVTGRASLDLAFFSEEAGVVVLASHPATEEPYRLEAWDAHAGRRLWHAAVRPPRDFPPGRSMSVYRLPGLSLDGRLLVCPQVDAVGRRSCRVHAVEEGRPLYELAGVTDAAFAPDARTLRAYHGGTSRLEARDAAGGALLAALSLPPAFHHEVSFAAGGRQAWAVGARTEGAAPAPGWAGRVLAWLRPVPPPADRDGTLVGVQWPSLRPLLRLAGTRVTGLLHAADGSFVITLHEEDESSTLVQCWDLPMPKPWGWVIGVPLALGVVLMGLRAWWSARRAGGTERAAEGERVGEPGPPQGDQHDLR